MTTVTQPPFAPNAPAYAATSTSSLVVVPAGTVVIDVLRNDYAYVVNMRVRVTAVGYPSVWMEGVVTSYITTSLSVAVDISSGSGTYTNWTINLAGDLGLPPTYPGTATNVNLAEQHAANAVTFSVKTLAGADASASNPVRVLFRDGTFRLLNITLSQVVAQGVTLDTVNNKPFRLWLLLIYQESGTIWRLGICQTRSSTNNISALPYNGILTYPDDYGSTAGKIYTTTASLSGTQQFVVLGYADYDTGLTTAGNWSASPTRIRLFGPGIQLPGSVVQSSLTTSGALAYTSLIFPNPFSDTIPTSGMGTQAFISQSITPNCTMNVLEVEAQVMTGGSVYINTCVFRSGVANGLAATWSYGAYSNNYHFVRLLAESTSLLQFSIRFGNSDGSTTVGINGYENSRNFGGSANSWIQVTERQS